MRPAFPFFVGSARSGTTLVRLMMNAHPELAIPRESHFIPVLTRRRQRYEVEGAFATDNFLDDLYGHYRFRRWGMPRTELRAALADPPATDLADAFRRIFAYHASTEGKPRYGDKTPHYALFMPELAELFPESRYVHVIRDARNVALSLLEVSFGPDRLDQALMFWRHRVESGRAAGRALGPQRYFEYRHEDLVEDPRAMAERICAFLDLPFDEQVMRHHEQPHEFKGRHMQQANEPPTKEGRDWRKIMTPDEVRLAERLCGDVLEELGYDRATAVEPLTAYERDVLVRPYRSPEVREVREESAASERSRARKRKRKRPAKKRKKREAVEEVAVAEPRTSRVRRIRRRAAKGVRGR